MRILGIETSCDETGAAVIETNTKNHVKLLSNVIVSSSSFHKKTGGIIPEVAAREQIKYMIPVLNEALSSARSVDDIEIDAIAVTVGPGLIGSLLVGVETAKTLSWIWNKPIIPVNHLTGHIYANWINTSLRGAEGDEAIPTGSPRSLSVARDDVITFPALALIVSGGHTDLVLMRNHKNIKWISGTRDDAAGEAFDKIGRLLGLAYPAGPAIEQLAKKADPMHFHFPRPLLHENTLDFSFSGLKTAVLREVQKLENPIGHQTICDIARATQDAIIDVLIKKTFTAAEKYQVKSILLGGGVAANQALRDNFLVHSAQFNVKFFAPAKNLCTDNAAMIAATAFFNYKEVPWRKITADPELYFD